MRPEHWFAMAGLASLYGAVWVLTKAAEWANEAACERAKLKRFAHKFQEAKALVAYGARDEASRMFDEALKELTE